MLRVEEAQGHEADRDRTIRCVEAGLTTAPPLGRADTGLDEVLPFGIRLVIDCYFQRQRLEDARPRMGDTVAVADHREVGDEGVLLPHQTDEKKKKKKKKKKKGKGHSQRLATTPLPSEAPARAAPATSFCMIARFLFSAPAEKVAKTLPQVRDGGARPGRDRDGAHVHEVRFG